MKFTSKRKLQRILNLLLFGSRQIHIYASVSLILSLFMRRWSSLPIAKWSNNSSKKWNSKTNRMVYSVTIVMEIFHCSNAVTEKRNWSTLNAVIRNSFLYFSYFSFALQRFFSHSRKMNCHCVPSIFEFRRHSLKILAQRAQIHTHTPSEGSLAK